MAEENREKLISVREAAKECGRNMETVRRWIWAGKLPAEKLGNQLFIKTSDLASYCRETAVKGYEAKLKLDFPEKVLALRGQMEDKRDERFDVGEEILTMRQQRMNEIGQSFAEGEKNMKAGSRTDLIKRMRKLREEIRARVGNLDAVGTLVQLRQERINELTRLR